MEQKFLMPTQFIRRAALKTPQVSVPMGKMVEYADVALTDVPDVRCWLCGGLTENRGQLVKKAIKDTFTDRDKARWPGSKSICAGCAFCLSFKSLRNYSILATKTELKHPSRSEIRDYLLEPPEPPFVFCIAATGQKWLHFRAQMAYEKDGFPVQFEETPVCVWWGLLVDWLESIETLYTVFSKEEILLGNYNQNRIRQFGLRGFQEYEGKIARRRGTRLFGLAVFVAQKKEKGKEGESVL